MSSLKKQKHPGSDEPCTNQTMPGRPGTATPKKTGVSDGDADSGFGIPDHKRKKQHKSSQADIGAYPTGHETTRCENGAVSKNPLPRHRGYKTRY
jgi:hypothetical protein